MTQHAASRRSAVAIALLAGLLGACGSKEGSLPDCIHASDCPAPANECVPPTCVSGTCRYAQIPPGGLVGTQPACQIRYCDATPAVVTIPDTSICHPYADVIGLTIPVEPDAPVVLQGAYLGGAQVFLDGLPIASTSTADGSQLSFMPPSRPVSYPLLGIVTPNGRFDAQIAYTLRRSSLRPLVVDGLLDDWAPLYLQDDHSDDPDWTFSDVLKILYVAYDRDGLWLGLKGGTSTDPANGLVIYLDTHYGLEPHAGVTDMSTLTDNGDPLSNACSSIVLSEDPYFKASTCAGTVGMASVRRGDKAPLTSLAGARTLVPGAALPWAVDASGGSLVDVATSLEGRVVEVFLSWEALGHAPHPPAGTGIAFVMRIVSPDGQAVSNQSMPWDLTPAPDFTTVYNFVVSW